MIIPPLVFRDIFVHKSNINQGHDFWYLKKKYDKHLKSVSHTHSPPQKKTLPFGDLNATQIFLPEKIQSILFSFLAQLVFKWHYKADGMLITKSQGADQAVCNLHFTNKEVLLKSKGHSK